MYKKFLCIKKYFLGCLPFLTEVMKLAYGNCVKEADEKAWDTWSDQINNALFGGKVDLLYAT